MKQRIELFFNEKTSCACTGDIMYDQMFIKHCEVYFIDKLKTRGFIFLGEMKESLGIIATVDDWTYVCDDINDWSFGCMYMDEGYLRISVLMKKLMDF